MDVVRHVADLSGLTREGTVAERMRADGVGDGQSADAHASSSRSTTGASEETGESALGR